MRKHTGCRALSLLAIGAWGVLAAACSEDAGGPTLPAPGGPAGQLALTIVSGNAQRAEAGANAEPLVVRVADATGAGVPNVVVTWVAVGPGILLDGAFDEHGEPAARITTLSNAQGLVTIAVLPLTFAPHSVFVHAGTCSTCSAHFTIDASDPGVTLAVTGGGEQQVVAGRLSQPLAVRVTRGTGEVAAGVLVHWDVTYGEAAFSGRIHNGRPVTSGSSFTNGDGVAEATLRPAWFGPLDVRVSLRGLHHAYEVIELAPAEAALDLEVVSGDAQPGKTFQELEQPLTMRVVAVDGTPVPHVRVDWTAQAGAGSFDDWWTNAVSAYTDSLGYTSARFIPWQMGTVRAAAQPAGSFARSTFSTQVNVMTVKHVRLQAKTEFIVPPCDWGGCYGFQGFALGGTIEWVNETAAARIVSTAVPEGAAEFDSGPIGAGQRFRFEPDRRGTWEYKDLITGTTSRLIVH